MDPKGCIVVVADPSVQLSSKSSVVLTSFFGVAVPAQS